MTVFRYRQRSKSNADKAGLLEQRPREIKIKTSLVVEKKIVIFFVSNLAMGTAPKYSISTISASNLASS